MTDHNESPSGPRLDTVRLLPPHLLLSQTDGDPKKFTLGLKPVHFGTTSRTNELTASEDRTNLGSTYFEIQQANLTCFIQVTPNAKVDVRLNDSPLTTKTALQDGDRIAVIDQATGQVIATGVVGLGFLNVAQPATSDDTLSAGFQRTEPENTAYIEMRWTDGDQVYFPITAERTVLGRAERADLKLPASLRYVSNQHAAIRRTDDGFQITDLDSANGTRVNNRLLEPGKATPLLDGSIIRIGDELFGVSVGLTFFNPEARQLPFKGYLRAEAAPIDVAAAEEVLIGSAAECDIVLQAQSVSRQHAKVQRLNGRYVLEDLSSTNGTLLNGQRITQAELQDGDAIEIGKLLLLFRGGQLVQYESYGMRIDVEDLSKTVRSNRQELRILHDISMTVLPREFVAIVGGSGAGKSTLMKALIGLAPGDGHVWINGRDYYAEYDHFRSQIGYVPQADILHTGLTVEQALRFAARLRLPSGISSTEREGRINAVLDTVEMNTEILRQTRIGRLSGGQRKRVSIAAELLADPKLIFLDEATSGLDPGLEKKMMNTLRRMADEGRTVILITHATANIVQVDHVAFISQGRLVYYGPPQTAPPFFEVSDFADIYQKIERDGEHWHRIFHEEKPENHQKYVLSRQEARTTVSTSVETPSSAKRKPGDSLRQFLILTWRALAVFRSDPITLALLLILLPVMALLQLLISTPNILIGDPSIVADPVAAARRIGETYMPLPKTTPFMFVTALEVALVGMYLPSNELIRERSIYLRERMVNLKLAPYLFSKISVFALFMAIQCALYLVILSLNVRLPAEGVYLPGPIEMFLTLLLTAVASVGIGLVISAIGRSTEMAIYILTLLVFFQLFFAGLMFDLRDNPAEPLSYLTTTRWSLLALGETTNIEQLAESTIICQPPLLGVGDPVCRNFPDARETLPLDYSQEDTLLQSWAVLLGMAAVTYILAGSIVNRASA